MKQHLELKREVLVALDTDELSLVVGANVAALPLTTADVCIMTSRNVCLTETCLTDNC